MSRQRGSSAAGWAAILVALIGFVSSPVWGPPICQAIGVCKPTPTPAPVPTGPPGGGGQTINPLPSFDFTPASIFLSQTNGPAGGTVKVSGEGFQAGEVVIIRFHTDEIARPRANANGTFSSVEVTVPVSYGKFAPQQFDVVATGQSSIKSARAPYMVSG
jgi:hypothetical protein